MEEEFGFWNGLDTLPFVTNTDAVDSVSKMGKDSDFLGDSHSMFLMSWGCRIAWFCDAVCTKCFCLDKEINKKGSKCSIDFNGILCTCLPNARGHIYFKNTKFYYILNLFRYNGKSHHSYRKASRIKNIK